MKNIFSIIGVITIMGMLAFAGFVTNTLPNDPIATVMFIGFGIFATCIVVSDTKSCFNKS